MAQNGLTKRSGGTNGREAAQMESGIGWFVSVNVSTEFPPEYIWATTNKISLVLINARI